MKSSMMKLLCERERIGHKNLSAKTGKKLNPNVDYGDDFDSGSNRHPISRNKQYGYDAKQFNENLNPLEGFLRKSVGKLWNDVYSELLQGIDKRKVIGQHVLTHLWQMVELHVEMFDGIPYERNVKYYHDKKLRKVSGFYVCPRTGILNYYKEINNYEFPKEVTSIHWEGTTYFELVTIFKTPCCSYGERFDKNSNECHHHQKFTENKLWYVVEYGYHSSDEVYDRRVEEGLVTVIYYRDVPNKLAEPFIIKKKVANKKELKLIRNAI